MYTIGVVASSVIPLVSLAANIDVDFFLGTEQR